MSNPHPESSGYSLPKAPSITEIGSPILSHLRKDGEVWVVNKIKEKGKALQFFGIAAISVGTISLAIFPFIWLPRLSALEPSLVNDDIANASDNQLIDTIDASGDSNQTPTVESPVKDSSLSKADTSEVSTDEGNYIEDSKSSCLRRKEGELVYSAVAKDVQFAFNQILLQGGNKYPELRKLKSEGGDKLSFSQLKPCTLVVDSLIPMTNETPELEDEIKRLTRENIHEEYRERVNYRFNYL